MKIKTIVLLIAGFFCYHTISAQNVGKRIERRAKHRAESRANQKVDRSVDKAVDNVFNGLFGKKKKKKKSDATSEGSAGQEDSEAYDEAEAERRAQEAVARMMGNGNREEWEPVKNDHPISFDMMISSERKNKTTTTTIKYTFDTWLLGMQMQQEKQEGEMLLLLDNEKGTMTTVVENDGKRQGYRMYRSAVDAGAMDRAMNDVTITATGNTKMIDGYFCREYLIKSEESTTNAWLTKEIQADFSRFYDSLTNPMANKSPKEDNQMLQFQEYGIMLAATTEMNNGKETTHTKISNIKTGDQIDRSILDVGEVEIMAIGN